MSADRRLLLSDCCCSTRTIRRSSRQKLFPTNFRRSPFAEHCWLYYLLLTARYLFALRCFYRWSLLAVWFLLLAAWVIVSRILPLATRCSLDITCCSTAHFPILQAQGSPFASGCSPMSSADHCTRLRDCWSLFAVCTGLPLPPAPPLVAAGSSLWIDWTE